MWPAPSVGSGVGGAEHRVSSCLYGSRPLNAMQKNAVNSGQGTAAVQHHIVPQVSLSNAQRLQCHLNRPLIHRQRPWGIDQVWWCWRDRRVRARVLDTFQPRARHNLCQGYTVSGHKPQRTHNNLLAGVWDVRWDGVRTPENTEPQSFEARTVKGERGCRHEVQQDAQSPDVHQRPDVTLVSKELWGGVGWRTTERCQVVAGFAFSTETKVTHFNAVGGGVEDVFSLQVAVDDVVVVLKGVKRKKCLLDSFIWLVNEGLCQKCQQNY